ncbi:uncharacterized protein LOC114531135 [Dendronephthya gigantea]|uniref:uncharacterized protein LOC114531135 n=1 Tax=Dendronephthya gigantea TaxID=151771 RepID=UPI001068E900|nr:uncharacterized protein LOC114531135 [Dendronephthya gigantea]
MRLYLDSNLVKFDIFAESKGFKLTHYVEGLSESIFDRIKDWENLLPSRLQADDKGLAKKCRDFVEHTHLISKNDWDGYHCFIGIRNSHAVLYFIPIESRETPYNMTGWHRFSSCYEVDIIRIHLAFSTDDTSRYAVYVNQLTRQFEEVPLFLCCNVLTSFKALQVLAYITALQLGNYRELESDCLEFTKAASRLASQQFATAREQAKSKVNLEIRVQDNLDDLTITNFKSEALSRRNRSARYPVLSSVMLKESASWIKMVFISLLVVIAYHFLFRETRT